MSKAAKNIWTTLRSKLHHLFILVIAGYLRQLIKGGKARRSRLGDVALAVVYPLISPLLLWFDEPKVVS